MNMNSYLLTGIAGTMLATYSVSYQLGKRYSESQYYSEKKKHNEPYKYIGPGEEVVPNIQLINYPRFKIVYSNVSQTDYKGPQDSTRSP